MSIAGEKAAQGSLALHLRFNGAGRFLTTALLFGEMMQETTVFRTPLYKSALSRIMKNRIITKVLQSRTTANLFLARCTPHGAGRRKKKQSCKDDEKFWPDGLY